MEYCGGSSHTPVDRAGGVKIEVFIDSLDLVIWKYLLLLIQNIILTKPKDTNNIA